ncbi:hypothetical protein AKJ56_01830 [candidate division MSBL1 archaeon SCGC-AAA382N08]|uniref:DJ-1/PfpI domain-containing protein n=1 Tax=candidate division MSBL1 archaeon SCGC-AAA382N08 TaxID=1698285 RepID=A0A133VNT4_9EURY|nr:hypothetical protein AKJ56_01830 [candidate division MSBL1 archaeon SCGC-AAA382N08]
MPQTATKIQTGVELKTDHRGKKAALVIAFEDFRDQEYFVPREVLEKAGLEVVTVSTSQGTARGADGGEVEVDLTLSELKVKDYEVVAFVGGPGTLDYLDNERSYEIVREVLSEGKLLGAICIAPVILAKAGVLKGKEVTVWSSSMNKDPIETVEQQGANYHDRSVVIDGNLVTADGPESARKFGRAILHALTNL